MAASPTDSLVWKRAGLAVRGFAFADGLAHYHRYTDDPECIDHASIQHGGSYALALARHLGQRELTNLRSPDLVYFDLFGRVLVRTSTLFSRGMAALTIALLVFVLARWRRTRVLSGWSMAKGAGLTVATLLASAAAVFGA
jgi:hypothetical protein